MSPRKDLGGKILDAYRSNHHRFDAADCEELAELITALTSSLRERWTDFRHNQHGWTVNDTQFKSHVQRFGEERSLLEKLLDRYNDLGCDILSDEEIYRADRLFSVNPADELGHPWDRQTEQLGAGLRDSFRTSCIDCSCCGGGANTRMNETALKFLEEIRAATPAVGPMNAGGKRHRERLGDRQLWVRLGNHIERTGVAELDSIALLSEYVGRWRQLDVAGNPLDPLGITDLIVDALALLRTIPEWNRFELESEEFIRGLEVEVTSQRARHEKWLQTSEFGPNPPESNTTD